MIANLSQKFIVVKIFLTACIAALLFFVADGQQKDASWYLENAPFPMPEISTPTFPGHDFSIRDYGAINDGQTLNTDAFKRAIDACASSGGGKVIVPPGLWLTGPIQLESNVDLDVERGALILFTRDHTQYPIIKSGGGYVVASPIYGYDLTNVAITGEGVIDGAGETWRPVKKEKTTAAQWKEFTTSGGEVTNDGKVWWPTKEAAEGEAYLKSLRKEKKELTPDDLLQARDYLRPYMVLLVNCKNVLVKNVTLRNSPKFVFYPNNCTNLTMNHVNIFNEWWAQNGDGIDISRCKNVFVYDCTVSAGDDGICMKSSGGKKDDSLAGLQNVVIAKCVVYHAHGGFVIGSNTDGGMQNIFVSDCNYIGTDIGVRVKSNCGRGGLVKNIYVKNIYMKDIVHAAISFDTYYEDMPAGRTKSTLNDIKRDKIPDFTDFCFDSIYCNGAKDAVTMRGLPNMPINNIQFKNMVISADNGFTATDASDIDLTNVKIITPVSPIYNLNGTKNFNIKKGYFPSGTNVFLKGDASTTGIHVTDTDLKNDKDAIETDGK